MEWAAIGVLITAAVIHASIVLLAMDERNRRKFAARERLFDKDDRPLFASKEDVDASIQRVHRRIDENRDSVTGAVSLLAGIDDRVGDAEQQIRVIEERQRNQWDAMTKDISSTVSTLRDVTKELREVSEMQRVLLDRMDRNPRTGG